MLRQSPGHFLWIDCRRVFFFPDGSKSVMLQKAVGKKNRLKAVLIKNKDIIKLWRQRQIKLNKEDDLKKESFKKFSVCQLKNATPMWSTNVHMCLSHSSTHTHTHLGCDRVSRRASTEGRVQHKHTHTCVCVCVRQRTIVPAWRPPRLIFSHETHTHTDTHRHTHTQTYTDTTLCSSGGLGRMRTPSHSDTQLVPPPRPPPTHTSTHTHTAARTDRLT